MSHLKIQLILTTKQVSSRKANKNLVLRDIPFVMRHNRYMVVQPFQLSTERPSESLITKLSEFSGTSLSLDPSPQTQHHRPSNVPLGYDPMNMSFKFHISHLDHKHSLGLTSSSSFSISSTGAFFALFLASPSCSSVALSTIPMPSPMINICVLS